MWRWKKICVERVGPGMLPGAAHRPGARDFQTILKEQCTVLEQMEKRSRKFRASKAGAMMKEGKRHGFESDLVEPFPRGSDVHIKVGVARS